MVFFLKKGQQIDSIESEKIPLDRVVALSIVEKEKPAMAPSAEGLAIAQRISRQKTAIPSGFIVRADNFCLEGQATIAGCLEGELFGSGKTEIALGGMVCGPAICTDLVISGVFDGDGTFERLTVKSGGECRGRVRGDSFTLHEGGIFDGEYSRRSV